MKNKLIKFLATGLGAGYAPLMPGTVGSLWGVLIYFCFHSLGPFFLIPVTLLITVGAVFVSSKAEILFGEKDCQKIVIDEVAGQLVAYLFIPYTLGALVVGFLFFRFFDTVKILGANWAQNKLPGGWGIVGDDVMAGLQAGVVFFIAFNWRT